MRTIVLGGLLTWMFAAAVAAQEPPVFPQPQKEHEWLHQFVGEWETESHAPAAAGQPAMTCKGTMRTRMLGGFWVVSESQVEAMGTTVNAVLTVGYDPQAKKYVGTWVDSLTNHLWKYEGAVDETGKKLTLEATGPNCMAPGKEARFRDAYEFTSKDEIRVTSSAQGEDGQWITFMTGTARRKK